MGPRKRKKRTIKSPNADAFLTATFVLSREYVRERAAATAKSVARRARAIIRKDKMARRKGGWESGDPAACLLPAETKGLVESKGVDVEFGQQGASGLLEKLGGKRGGSRGYKDSSTVQPAERLPSQACVGCEKMREW